MSRQNTWVVLPDHDGHEVSPRGAVRNRTSGQILNSSLNQAGVRYVSIRNTRTNKYENVSVSRLVASAFCEGHSPDCDTILHLDGDPQNNRADNLVWAPRWHAIQYHQEIALPEVVRRTHIRDERGNTYRSTKAAAIATGCLPSAIDYSVRYNDSLSTGESINVTHKVWPGGHIFRSV